MEPCSKLGAERRKTGVASDVPTCAITAQRTP